MAELEAENARLRAALAERAVVEARESRIRLVADALPVLISYIDAEGRYRFNNRAYEQWFGRDRRELAGKHLREVLGDEAFALLEPMIAQVMAGERVSAERELPYRDGGPRSVHIDYVPDRGEDGGVAGFFALVQDVSERRRAERALRESEGRFHAMADSVDQMIWSTLPDGHHDYYNRRWYEYTGVPEGSTDGEAWNGMFHPDDQERAWEVWRRSLASGEPYEIEYRLRHRSGDYRWVLGRAQPVRDAGGAIARWYGTCTDIHDLKLAEEALRESEARYRTLFSSMDEGFCIIEFLDGPNGPLDDYIHVEANPAYEFHTGIANVVGQKVREMVPGEADGWVRLYRDVLVTGRPIRFERELEATGRHLELSAFRIEPAERRQVAVLFQDTSARKQAEAALKELNQSLEARIAAAVTERAQVEEALRQSQKMEAVGQLTGGIAHDFNNLLTIIQGNIDAARRHVGEEGEARVQRALGNAMVGAERAAVLTQRLLAFSRRQPLNPRPVDANKLVTGMGELLHRTLGETIEVETVLAAGLWRIEADPNQLENAILNLAVNARDAMPKGGKLTIETANMHLDRDYAAQNAGALPGQYVSICVSDIGSGMNEDTLARAFEPFFTTKEVGKGTGLGLSMVYGFVKQSGGHIKIYSEEGQGTTVRIYLPRLIGGEGEEEERAVAHVPEGSREETILVCEDDDDVRAYTVDVLRELGYRVLEAHDGPSAIRLLERQEGKVDLLFTDVVLPGGMTGAIVAEQARRLRPDLRILFTTGYARNAIVHHGRLDPGVELITKPFAYADLAARIRDMLDRPV